MVAVEGQAAQQPEEQAPNRYSVQIMLPDDEELRLRAWAQTTLGATWPSWGGHVTLVNAFTPLCDIRVIERDLQDLTKAFSPFDLLLDQPICVEHWRRPDLHTVLLVNRTRADEGYRALLRLRTALVASLQTQKRDLVPEVSQRPYMPHLMLTWGLPEGEALALTRLASDAEVKVSFRVEHIWLLDFIAHGIAPGAGQLCRRRSFPLGGGVSEERLCIEPEDD